MAKARAVMGEWSRILLKLMLEILTNILKSYTPSAPGVVSSAGADQREQNFRLKTVFPVLGRGEIPKPQETCRSHLGAGQCSRVG